MKRLNLTRPIAFLDIESTGKNPLQDKIIEIAIIKINQDETEEVLNLLFNPGISIPQESVEIHGITDEDVKEKPFFKEFANDIFEFLRDCDLGGFSIKKFDLPLLQSEFKRAGISYSIEKIKIIDVLTIYHKFHPRDLTAAYREYCDKDLNNAHRSEADVRATIEIFKSQLNKHEDLPQNLEGLHEFCSWREPNWIDSEGKFIWANNNTVFNFGVKHKGKTLEQVFNEDKNYFAWIISADFSEEIKNICREALQGIFFTKK